MRSGRYIEHVKNLFLHRSLATWILAVETMFV